ncbi:MAG TPA: NEW3 domain-containing protein [Dongiaceae bacterium]|nr:NEW3 domain-containing protein [Dongiaceae bacterium]
MTALAPHAGAEPLRGLWLTTDYPSLTVRAGDNADIQLKLRNSGEAPAPLKLAVEGAPKDWQASFTGGGQTVEAAMPASDESVDLDLHLKIPADAKSGTQDLVVSARSDGENLQLPLEVTIGDVQPAHLEAKSDLPSLKGSPSTSFDYSFNVKNDSAKKQLVSLNAQVPQNFQASFTEGYGSQEISSIPIDPGQSKDLKVKVQPPADATAGDYQFKVTAAAGGLSTDLPLAMEITGQPHLRLSGKDDRLSAAAEAGKSSTVDLLLTNDGSAPAQNIALTAAAPGEWNVTFDNKTVDQLAPGETKTVTAFLAPPSKALAGDYMTTFRADAGGESSSADFRISVTTSTLWGIVGVGLIAVALLVLVGAVVRFGRR